MGKSTVARHLLLPRITHAELVAVESLNSHEGASQGLRGHQCAELQEYLQTVDSAVVDIGASNVEELMSLMRKYRGSHEDFDCFVVPTVPALKQQQDTIATLVDLSGIGVPSSRLKLVFNMVEDGTEVAQAFQLLLSFLEQEPIAQTSVHCHMGANEIYARIRNLHTDLATLVADETDYKRLIAQADNTEQKLILAQRLATRRLATGVVPELDACFAALELGVVPAVIR